MISLNIPWACTPYYAVFRIVRIDIEVLQELIGIANCLLFDILVEIQFVFQSYMLHDLIDPVVFVLILRITNNRVAYRNTVLPITFINRCKFMKVSKSGSQTFQCCLERVEIPNAQSPNDRTKYLNEYRCFVSCKHHDCLLHQLLKMQKEFLCALSLNQRGISRRVCRSCTWIGACWIVRVVIRYSTLIYLCRISSESWITNIRQALRQPVFLRL
jgi:hypothetical protein